jgi:high-affinity iron transporter
MTPAVWYALRGLGLLGLIAFFWTTRLAVAHATPAPAQLLLHLLDYVAVDYPEFVQEGTVLDQAEYDEQVEFSQQARALLD